METPPGSWRDRRAWLYAVGGPGVNNKIVSVSRRARRVLLGSMIERDMATRVTFVAPIDPSRHARKRNESSTFIKKNPPILQLNTPLGRIKHSHLQSLQASHVVVHLLSRERSLVQRRRSARGPLLLRPTQSNTTTGVVARATLQRAARVHAAYGTCLELSPPRTGDRTVGTTSDRRRTSILVLAESAS